ncbi:3-dehydroquinate synthase [hydrothermal vent metagenome]|uniref:3-dehydroquinate synthase n=1 Tax=hydrothermal vent metagenome TaxID=652676 RepID=A0A3B1CET6_9ZZZZ
MAGSRIKKIGDTALVVSNRRVFGLYGERLGDTLSEAGVDWRAALLPDGERSKTMASVEKLHNRLVDGKYDRDAMIIALGGGVIGDTAGFAAATYMRGIKIIQAPTTLLSQVDSSVGGKTGVNHPRGKNLIGAFHQPSLVLADISALKSLPAIEILGGIAEVIKYGCIASARFFRFLEENVSALAALKADVTTQAVKMSCRIKAKVVSEDEFETGRRAILNFGHTAGHAIEAVTGYKRFGHGYAVAMGMRVAAELSYIKGALKEKELERIKNIIKKTGLPAKIPHTIKKEALVNAMAHDKKVKKSAIRFVLLDGIGGADLRNDITRNEILDALKRSYEK